MKISWGAYQSERKQGDHNHQVRPSGFSHGRETGRLSFYKDLLLVFVKPVNKKVPKMDAFFDCDCKANRGPTSDKIAVPLLQFLATSSDISQQLIIMIS